MFFCDTMSAIRDDAWPSKQRRAKCPKFVHLSSLLNLSRHTHVKIVLWPAVLIKHINVEQKKHKIMKK